MIHDRLTDYQVAEAFQGSLSRLYKAKMQELNEELQPIYNHLDKLNIPQVPEFHRWFAHQCLPDWAKFHLKAIYHIQRIRRIKLNDTTDEKLDIEKARNVPIETLYPFKFKGKNVSCPLHVDNSPSMKINKNNTVKCFSCQFFGDSIKLFMALNKCSFPEAVRQLCQ